MVDKVAAPNELGQLQALLGLVGGKGATTSTTPTNTAPLQGVLANLQGVDYNAMLQSIFQQAAGNIPGMQAATGRAVGARTSGNAAMQAALQELLKQTTLAGQQQIATQQNQNLATQAQAASNLRGTKQQVAQPSQLGQMAALIGLLQAGTKLGGFKNAQEMFGAITGTNAGQAPTPVRDANVIDVAPVDFAGATAPQMSMAPAMGYDPVADLMGAAQSFAAPAVDYGTPGGMSQAPVEFNPVFNVADYAVTPEPQYDMSYAPEEWFQSPDVMSYF